MARLWGEGGPAHLVFGTLSSKELCVQLNDRKQAISSRYMLDVEHLQNFLHIVDQGSLSEAARRAHVSQPALSRQLRLLEEDVGVQLFERTGRGMRPTLEGRRLELRTRPLLNQLDGLQREFSTGPISGPVTLAVTPSMGMAWTASLVQKFRARFSDVDLRVVVALSGAIGDAIERGKFDLGVLYSPLGSDELETTDLWVEESYFVCRRGSEFASKKQITFRKVIEQPLILPSSKHGVRALLEEQAKKAGVDVNVEMDIDSVQLAMELVKQGAGNMVLTGRALNDIAVRNLEAIPIRRPALVRAAQLATSESGLLRPAVRALWDFMLEEAQGGA